MFRFHRFLVGYAVAIPLAMILGYLVATPDMASVAVVGLVLFVLVLPLLIQWNHWLVVFFWNSAFVANFLPGSVPLWLVFAVLTLIMAMVHFVMGHRSFLRAPELLKPILLLMAVVIFTAKIRGNLGMRLLGGSSFGGKHYFLLLGAILGYFALISQPISLAKSGKAVKWFYLSGLSYGLPNLLYGLGPAFFVLYYFVSVDFAYGQAATDASGMGVKRLGGVGPMATAILCWMLARWGIRGIFEWNKPWRVMLLVGLVAGSMFSGFRSQLIILALLFATQFITEGLWRTSLLPICVMLGILCVTPMLLFANKMPGAVQRTLALFPVDIDPQVRADATGSSEWRFTMWRMVWPEVPKYLLVGKGYSIDPIDLYLSAEASRSGLISSYEGSMMAGDYHNGPLSVLMPFGFFGAVAFLWLLVAGVKVLSSNFRYGDAQLKRVNAFLLSYFVAQALFFLLVFGALESGLPYFLGALGFSVSLNGGVRRRPALARQPALSSSLAAPVAAV